MHRDALLTSYTSRETSCLVSRCLVHQIHKRCVHPTRLDVTDLNYLYRDAVISETKPVMEHLIHNPTYVVQQQIVRYPITLLGLGRYLYSLYP